MAIQEILGTDIGRDAFKIKVNQNFAAHEELISSLNAEVHQPDYTPVLKRQEPIFSVGTGYDNLGVLQDLKSSIIKGQVPINAKGLSAVNIVNGSFINTIGWNLTGVGTPTLANNEITFTATASNGNIAYLFKFHLNHKYYFTADVKSTSNLVRMGMDGFANALHSGSGKYERLSFISEYTVEYPTGLFVVDARTSGWTTVSVMNAMAIDLTAIDLAIKTKLECDYMFPRYFDGIGSVNNVRIKSVGKNLFNPDEFREYLDLYKGSYNVSDGVELDGSEYWEFYNTAYHLKIFMRGKFRPNTQYTVKLSIKTLINGATVVIAIRYIDGSDTYISADLNTYQQKVGISTYGNTIDYIYISYGNGSYARIKKNDISIIETTLDQTYEPYQESISYLPNMHSLPNGVVDEIVDGKSINKIVSYKLKASDIVNHGTDTTIVDYASITMSNMSNIKNYGSDDNEGTKLISQLTSPRNNAVFDSSSNYWKHYISGTTLVFTFPKGTYTTLAQAQTALAETEILYERAIPIIEDAVAPLTVFENGTISAESDKETTIPELTFEYPLEIASVISRLNEAVNQNAKLINDKADKTQEDWIVPTLLNAWVTKTGFNNPARYMKDTSGFVHLKGLVSGGTIGQAIFSLPKGYRPNESILIITTSNDASGITQVIPDTGSVIAFTGSNVWYSLDGISFKAER